MFCVLILGLSFSLSVFQDAIKTETSAREAQIGNDDDAIKELEKKIDATKTAVRAVSKMVGPPGPPGEIGPVGRTGPQVSLDFSGNETSKAGSKSRTIMVFQTHTLPEGLAFLKKTRPGVSVLIFRKISQIPKLKKEHRLFGILQ